MTRTHIYSIFFIGTLLVSLFIGSCKTGHAEVSGYLAEVPYPQENPQSAEKIELGRKLFFDKRLSRDESISCASCHHPEYAFTDRKKVSDGVGGGKTERNAPSLLNSAFLKTAMFDAHLTSLEMQVIVPIQEHVEMDMKMGELIERLKKDPYYTESAERIFNRKFDAYVLTRSIAAFERSLVSLNSRFDRYYYGQERSMLTQQERRGWKIFSEKLYCTKCHPAPFFTTFEAECNGLYLDYGNDKGRFRIHGDTMDMGKFKVPSLRNIELTYPYMHDGSIESLDAVIDHYAKGGADYFNKHPIIKPFEITVLEKSYLIAFLKSLTDTSYIKKYR
jgi:cytochrome c peroxidase